MAKITLGIDISKAKFDAAVLLVDNKVKTKKFENKIDYLLDTYSAWIIKKDSTSDSFIEMERLKSILPMIGEKMSF